MIDLIRMVFRASFLVGGLVLLVVVRDEWKRERWMGCYGPGGPVAVLVVSAVTALLAGLWLLRMI